MQILVTGSVAFDYLMRFPGQFRDLLLPDQLGHISLSFLVDALDRRRGGTAPNIAYTMALLGARPRVMATVGEDFAEYRAFLDAAGVDTALMEAVPGKFTASFFCTTDGDNAQIASFYTGAMAEASRQSVAAVSPRPDLVVISPNDPAAMARFAAECRSLGIPYLYDPGQQVARLDGADLARGLDGARFLFVNDYEFGLVCQKTGLDRKAILDRVGVLVVTKGEEGAVATADGRDIAIPIFPPDRIVDPTGVGDAFRGGFLTALGAGLGWELCGRVGALAATCALEHLGPQSHSYTPAEFVARFRSKWEDGGALEALVR
jgi:adenosine kinase